MNNYFSLHKAPDILLKIIKVSILVVLFLPLIMNSSYFFPFIVFKNVLFRIFVEVALVAYLSLAYLRPEYRPSFNLKSMNKVTLAIVAFFLISTIAGIFGIGVYRSFWSNYERMAGIFHLFHLVAFFVVLVNVFKNKKDWHSFFTFSIFSSLLMSFLAFAQYLQIPFLLQSSGGTRLTGTIGNATFLAAYLIFNLFFIAYFFVKRSRFDLKLFATTFLALDVYLIVSSILNKIPSGDWGLLNILKAPFLEMSLEFPALWIPFFAFQTLVFAAWFYKNKLYIVEAILGISFLFNFFIFYNTQTRGAIIGLAVSVAFLALITIFKQNNKRIKLLSAAFLISVILIPVGIFLGKDTSLVQNNNTLRRLATISLTDTTTESRLLTWKASWQGLAESPKSFLIGYGPENYYYAFNKYFPTEVYKDEGSRVWFDRAHNIIFDISVTTGILGLIAYLGMLGFATYYMLARYKKGASISSSLLWASLLVAYFIQNFFVFDTINTEIPFFLALAFMVFLASKNDEEDDQNSSDQITNKFNIFYHGALIAVLIFGIFVINIKTLKANEALVAAVISQEIKLDSEESKEVLFEKAINASIIGRFEAREQFADFVSGFSKNESVDRNFRASLINKVEEELQKTISEEPKHVRHHLYLTNFMNATFEFNSSNPDKIIDLITNEAIPLSPTRPQLYYEAGQAYAFKQDFESAFEFFKKGSDLAPWVIEDHWNLITLSMLFEQFDIADQEFGRLKENFDLDHELARIHDTPKGQLLLSGMKKLAQSYISLGQEEKAVETFEFVVNAEPIVKNYAEFALVYAQLGNIVKAKEIAQKVIEMDPSSRAETEEFIRRLDSGEF